jgi:hypothetical protein
MSSQLNEVASPRDIMFHAFVQPKARNSDRMNKGR